MGVSPHIRRLRESVGHDLLLLPAVAVLPRDTEGRMLLVRHADSGMWATIGGSVEVDESPQHSALREAAEEAGVDVELGAVLASLGGPEFRVTYPNGDMTAYVSTVFDATVIGGEPHPDNDEVTEVGWFSPSQLRSLELDTVARAILRAVGLLDDSVQVRG